MTGRASLVQADIPFQVDIGFGDAVSAVESTTDIPVFLDDLPVPKLKVYPVEIVIAEKFQAMVTLGLVNSRMKDFFDIVTLANTFPLQSDKLQTAIRATFDRRETLINNDPLYIFSDKFKANNDKQTQWQAFIKKNRLANKESFKMTVDKIQSLLEPIYQNINNRTQDDKHWNVNTGSWE